MKYAFVYLLLCCPAFAGTFVDNGGVGVRAGREIIPADIYELHTIGRVRPTGVADPLLTAVWNAANLPFDFPAEAISARLAEANRLYPRLGDHLLRTIKIMEWRFTDEPLELVIDADLRRRFEPSMLAQIAVRNGVHVRIGREPWGAMSETSRVALVLHEAAQSLADPRCDANGESCLQEGWVARAIVAAIFGGDGSRLASYLSHIPALENAPASGWRIWNGRAQIVIDEKFSAAPAGRTAAWCAAQWKSPGRAPFALLTEFTPPVYRAEQSLVPVHLPDRAETLYAGVVRITARSPYSELLDDRPESAEACTRLLDFRVRQILVNF